MHFIRLAVVSYVLFTAPFLASREPDSPPSPDPAWAQMQEAWQKGGEAALREYVRQNRESISPKMILETVSRSIRERSEPRLVEERLSIGLAAAEEIGSRNAEADVLRMAADYYNRSGDNDRAAGFYDRALPLYRALGNPALEGEVLLGRGRVFLMTGDIPKARSMYEQALALCEKADLPLVQGKAYVAVGDLHANRAEMAQALHLYEKALPFLEKAKDAHGPGIVCFKCGEIYKNTGDIAQARAMYEKALLLLEKSGNLTYQGNVYISLCILGYQTGDLPKALSMGEKALHCYERANSAVGLGNAYCNLGLVHCFSGDYAKSLAMYELALPFYEKARYPWGLGNVQMRRGDVYFRIGDNGQALAMFEKALSIVEKIDNPIYQANVYRKIGDVRFRTGAYDQARAMYGKALDAYEKADSALGKGNMLLKQGEICRKTGSLDQAISLYDQAQAVYEKIGHLMGVGDTFQCRADLSFQQNDWARAVSNSEKALDCYVRSGFTEGQLLSLRRQGLALAKQSRDAQALDRFEKSFELLEQIRRHTGVEELKMRYLEDRLDYIEEAAGFMLRAGYAEKAFQTAERMKARLFLDRLAEGLVDLEKGVDPDLRGGLERLESDLDAARKKMQEPSPQPLQSEESEKRKAEIALEIGGIEARLAEMKARIRLRNPLYASVQYPEPPAVAEMQNKVLSENEVLLEYFLGKQDAWCFVLTRKSFRAVKLPMGTEELNRTTSRLLSWIVELPAEGIERGSGEKPEIPRPIMADARRLYNGLIAPMGKDIRGKSIIIVPDGILSRLPFEALAVASKGKTIYLIENQAVSYTPSAAVLLFYRTRYHRSGASERFIGLGDPVYDYEKFRAGEPESRVNLSWETLSPSLARRNEGSAGAELERLPGTGEEVRAVERLFRESGRDEKAFLRDEAREELIHSDLVSSGGYIHLAAHGILGDDYQAIALSRIPGSKEDGLLSLGEIMNLKWNARLVVLSACETGLGPIQRGEGVTGLARAVMYAGSPAAVVSLWSVSDVGTRELMTRFYGKMIRDGLPPPEALRRAKREMAASAKWNSPFFWAAFVLYGE
ncbi:MAG: CHAT domain-containing protein [Acidobacteria bacterium]|nr:CHAT domain-containing protein [Acidobacteriota bacterium]